MYAEREEQSSPKELHILIRKLNNKYCSGNSCLQARQCVSQNINPAMDMSDLYIEGLHSQTSPHHPLDLACQLRTRLRRRPFYRRPYNNQPWLKNNRAQFGWLEQGKAQYTPPSSEQDKPDLPAKPSQDPNPLLSNDKTLYTIAAYVQPTTQNRKPDHQDTLHRTAAQRENNIHRMLKSGCRIPHVKGHDLKKVIRHDQRRDLLRTLSQRQYPFNKSNFIANLAHPQHDPHNPPSVEEDNSQVL